jgi:hypothetical protein
MRQMQPPEYQLGWETFEQMMAAKRYNKSRILIVGNKTAPINAGNEDKVFVYTNDVHICVLSVNTKIGYVGLDIFDMKLNMQFDIFVNQDTYLYLETIADIGIDGDEDALIIRLYSFVLENFDI